MAFYRVEKSSDFTVVSNHYLRNEELSTKAVGLFTRILALPDSWDFSIKGLATKFNDGVDFIRSAVKELEQHGYIVRRQVRRENGQISDTVYDIYESPVDMSSDMNNIKKPVMGKPILVEPVLENPATENPIQLSTYKPSSKELNTHPINIHPSIYPHSTGEQLSKNADICISKQDRIDEIESYRELIQENIDYDILADRYGSESVGELVDLMVDTICSKRSYIRVGGDDKPKEVVKSCLLKINSSHIEYVLDCKKKNTTKVFNIKNYLITSLYNSTMTIDSYYQAEVNHDMYGGRGTC